MAVDCTPLKQQETLWADVTSCEQVSVYDLKSLQNNLTSISEHQTGLKKIILQKNINTDKNLQAMEKRSSQDWGLFQETNPQSIASSLARDFIRQCTQELHDSEDSSLSFGLSWDMRKVGWMWKEQGSSEQHWSPDSYCKCSGLTLKK